MNKVTAEALQKALEATLSQSLQLHTKIAPWCIENDLVEFEAFATCTMDMRQNGTVIGLFILALHQVPIDAVLSAYGLSEMTDTVRRNDAAEEITNMVYGSFKKALAPQGSNFIVTLPQRVTKLEEFKKKIAQHEKLLLPFLVNGAPCWAIVAQNA